MRGPILGVSRLEALGPALRDLRRSFDKKLAWVAAQCTTTPTHLGQWERSARFPTFRSLMDLLKVYNYQVVLIHTDDLNDFIDWQTRQRRGEDWDE